MCVRRNKAFLFISPMTIRKKMKKQEPTPSPMQAKSKKSIRGAGRPRKDWSEVSGSIPMEPEEFVKILLNTPPRTIKNR